MRVNKSVITMTQEPRMEENSFFQKIIDSVQNKSDSKMIFGEPIEQEGRKIITVGQVHYRFAGGSGSAQGESEAAPETEQAEGSTPPPQGSGAGGFGAVQVDPVGVIEITPEETEFIPIIRGREVLLAFIGGLLLGWLLHRK